MYSARDPLTVSTMAATSRIRRFFLWVAILADFKMPNRSAMPASTTQSLRSKACNVWHQTRCPWSPSSLRCVRYWTTSGKLFTKVDAGPACDTNLVGEKLTDSKLLLRSSPWSNFVQARKYPWAWLLDCTCVTIRPFATWDPSKAHIIVSTPVQASSKNRTWPPQACDFLCAPGPSVGASVKKNTENHSKSMSGGISSWETTWLVAMPYKWRGSFFQFCGPKSFIEQRAKDYFGTKGFLQQCPRKFLGWDPCVSVLCSKKLPRASPCVLQSFQFQC